MTGKKLKQYLKERGIRARWVADKMDLTPQAVYFKLDDKVKITMEDALKVKKACRMSESEFESIFSGEEWYSMI